MAIDALEDRILWDRDFEMEDHADNPFFLQQ